MCMRNSMVRVYTVTAEQTTSVKGQRNEDNNFEVAQG